MLLRRTSEIVHKYTDDHDVDEDLMTMSAQSGYWCDHISAGIARRSVIDYPSGLSDTVASSYIQKI